MRFFFLLPLIQPSKTQKALFEYVKTMFNIKFKFMLLGIMFGIMLPDITKESSNAISIKDEEMKNLGIKLFGCLIMDEMSIKQHVQWTGSRHQGYVDYGPGGSRYRTYG